MTTLSPIKENMFDPDTIMTTEESKRFEQSLNELKEGKTVPISKLKKEPGIYNRQLIFYR